jgi:dephospho-CoA kinase
MAYLIGITGGIGGGKSTVTSYLTEQGAVVIDTDAIAREIACPGSEALDEIREIFGDSVFCPDGNLDRKAVAEIVFSDEQMLAKLNAVLHPRIRKRWQKEAEQAGAPFVFVVIPLLYENKLDDKFDEVWVVTADEEERIRRVMDRDRTERESVVHRMRNQLPEEEKVAAADVVIDTTSGYDATRTSTLFALLELKRRLGLEET